MRTARIRFRFEVALAVLAVGLAALTLISRDWIEVIFAVDPDKGSGALEWAITVAPLVAAAAFGLVALRERKRHVDGSG